MEKEKQALIQLRDKQVDIELVFLRDILDRVILSEKSCCTEYFEVYRDADEDTRWEFTRRFKEKINRQLFMWDQFIDSMALEECYKEIFNLG
ncbi:MAG: hypothetical protein ACRCSG_04060 [Cellulosilyticaceae bacterium]